MVSNGGGGERRFEGGEKTPLIKQSLFQTFLNKMLLGFSGYDFFWG